MSFNGSGLFSINTSGQPVVASTLISASVFNAFTADVATGLSTTICKDGQTTITANIPFAGFRLTGLGAGSAAGHSVRYEQILGVVTTAGDLLQASAAGALARLAIGAAGTRLHSTGTAAEWQGTWFKAGAFTRDTSLASGNVAYTGVGFKPKAIIFLNGLASPNEGASVGLDDGTTPGGLYHIVSSGWISAAGESIVINNGVDAQQGHILTFDADGFTLAWTKVASPTGTISIRYLALR